MLTYAAMAFFRFAVTDADKRRVRRAFAHYVEPTLLDRLDEDESLLRLGGDLRDLTVMFSDVRNFSALSERTAPTEVVAILNRVFAALGAAIIGHHGTIDKFMGDAVMAFWNAPATLGRHPLHACRAALAMRVALQRLNAESAFLPAGAQGHERARARLSPAWGRATGRIAGLYPSRRSSCSLLASLAIREVGDEDIAHCAEIGGTINPHLADFYAACRARADDFAALA